jgi:hypothetical protein
VSSAEYNEAPVLVPENNLEMGKDSIAKLKERLRLADLCYSELEELYKNYRLRWLEECYWTRILEEYAPVGISIPSSSDRMEHPFSYSKYVPCRLP